MWLFHPVMPLDVSRCQTEGFLLFLVLLSCHYSGTYFSLRFTFDILSLYWRTVLLLRVLTISSPKPYWNCISFSSAAQRFPEISKSSSYTNCPPVCSPERLGTPNLVNPGELLLFLLVKMLLSKHSQNKFNYG